MTKLAKPEKEAPRPNSPTSQPKALNPKKPYIRNLQTLESADIGGQKSILPPPLKHKLAINWGALLS